MPSTPFSRARAQVCAVLSPLALRFSDCSRGKGREGTAAWASSQCISKCFRAKEVSVEITLIYQSVIILSWWPAIHPTCFKGGGAGGGRWGADVWKHLQAPLLGVISLLVL